MAQGLLDANPVTGTQSRPGAGEERVLSLDELRAIWKATEHASADNAAAPIIRLLLITGQRGGEIAGLKWSEIEDDRIVLPGERVKNGVTHMAPLSQTASDIIAARPRTGEFVFGRSWRRTVQRLVKGQGGNRRPASHRRRQDVRRMDHT